MGKFCIYCGSQLEEGKECTCQASVNAKAPTSTQNAQAPTGGTTQSTVGATAQSLAQNEKVQQAKGIALKVWDMEKKLVMKPVSSSKEFMANKDIKLIICFFVLQALTSAIFGLAFVKKAFGDTIKTLEKYSDDVKMPYFTAFIVTILISVALSFALAALVWGISKLFKRSFTFIEMANLTAIRSGILSATAALSIIIALGSAKYGIMLFFFGNIFGIIVMAICFPTENEAQKNSIHFIMVVSTLIFLIVSVKVMDWGVSYYFPEEMRDGIQEAGGLFKGMSEEFESFGGLLGSGSSSNGLGL